ncbi:MAG: helix-turn-helix domain-containing protein [SAR324 cluster bacterium]|nr:helix-turn-helix domain-containing protein [SAR324 cluster bacterium]
MDLKHERNGNGKNSCFVEQTVQVIGGRWKLLILKNLFSNTLRFSELQRAIPAVSQRMLTQQLRELEADGIISRKVYPQVPPKVEYSQTELGESLGPILEAMNAWGEDFVAGKKANPEQESA